MEVEAARELVREHRKPRAVRLSDVTLCLLVIAVRQPPFLLWCSVHTDCDPPLSCALTVVVDVKWQNVLEFLLPSDVGPRVYLTACCCTEYLSEDSVAKAAYKKLASVHSVGHNILADSDCSSVHLYRLYSCSTEYGEARGYSMMRVSVTATS